MQYFGQRTGLFTSVALITALVAGSVTAQSLRNARPPAELPPLSYTANQYIDSNGCAFVRAGISGTTQWVPRVSRNREQLCGFQPTNRQAALPEAPAPEPAPTPAAAPEPVVAQAPAPAPEPATTPARTAAPRPAPVAAPAPAPRQTQSQPRAVRPAVAAAAPTPRVITQPEPEQQPRRITRAQACAGRTGVQPNMISSRTGQPIDCGGAPASRVVAAVEPAETAAPSTGQQRFTRAQACADAATSGRRYISARTGQPIQCGAATGTDTFARLRADLALPQAPYSNPLDAAPGSTYFPTPNGTIVVARSGQVRTPYSNPLDSAPGSTFVPRTNTSVTPTTAPSPTTVTRAQTAPSRDNVIAQLLNPAPPPYSNPTGYALPAATVPDGYARVWNDGRLNQRRGLPTAAQMRAIPGYGRSTNTNLRVTNTVRYAQAAPAQAQEAAPQARVSTRVAAPQAQTQMRSEQISGHRYVQVATFGSRDQAQSVAQSLRARGLPMRIGVFNQNGQQMRMVLAGPFTSDAELQNALGTARGAGFSGAFTRR